MAYTCVYDSRYINVNKIMNRIWVGGESVYGMGSRKCFQSYSFLQEVCQGEWDDNAVNGRNV